MIHNYTSWSKLNEDFKTKLTQSQIDWCDKHIMGTWSVDNKGHVTVPLNVEFKDKNFTRFEVQFADIKGNFYCYDCPNLESLQGAPSSVGRNFSCHGCPNLESLEGAPSSVGGDF